MTGTRVRSVERIHRRLRASIMRGELAPGAVLSQVALARTYGVSRTPLREAIRRLEAEGLVEAIENQRARVATADAESLDVRFTEFILVEAMGVNVTVPYLTEIDLNEVLAATTALRVASEKGPSNARDRARRALHLRYVAGAGERLRAAIAAQFDACERYRRLYVDLPAGLGDAYAAIAGHCVRRNAAGAAREIGRIQAVLAGAILAAIDPAYRPVAIHTALQMLESAQRV